VLYSPVIDVADNSPDALAEPWSPDALAEPWEPDALAEPW
jgi:hypothetical protein